MFCLHVHLSPHECMVPVEVREDIMSSGSGVTDGCEPPIGYCDFDPGPGRAAMALTCWAISLVPLCSS